MVTRGIFDTAMAASQNFREVDPTPEPGLLDDKELNRALLDRLASITSANDLATLRRIRKSCSSGLQFAFDGAISSAQADIEHARTLMTDLAPSQAVVDVATSAVAAAEAFVAYKQGRYDRARTLLLIAMDCDERLETIHCQHWYHLHRIHLIENLIRVTRHLDIRAAVTLGIDLLKYLGEVVMTPKVSGQWSLSDLALPRENVRLHSVVTAGELALCMCCLEPQLSWDLFFELVAPLPDLLIGRRYIHPDTLAWLQTRDPFMTDNLESYSAAAMPILHQGPTARNCKLWCGLSIDLLCLTHQTDPPTADSLTYCTTQLAKWHFSSPRIDTFAASVVPGSEYSYCSHKYAVLTKLRRYS
jgi:hypothetical protein